ncbi:unnamed protein product [Kluyveromyces dobzhanskii CBS 2104]|uniref:Protein transport protein SEC23 n=1 Tax=Kluyveromyces dobzhanskii CBS 2104 TaxID=1427455 RepID=A0A0A8L4Z1_9SACH|nr:unnamed protein product [Kluyveromyces dobzhanskii CBS 2104]
MIELNYGAVPTSRTDSLARLLDCGDDNRGSISAICESDLTIHDELALQQSVNYTACENCGGFVNYLCSRDFRKGWFCSFCNSYNESGDIPSSLSYSKQLGIASSGTNSKAVVIIDLNCEFAEDLKALKRLQFSDVDSWALITIGNGTVTVHSDQQSITIDAESSSMLSHLKKFDTEWFNDKYRLSNQNIWTDQTTFRAKVHTLLPQQNNKKKRCKRNVALAIFLASCLKPQRSIGFVFGPGTVAPAKVISLDKKNHIRQHRNIEEGKDLKYWKNAIDFYRKMSESGSFVPCSLFIASMDQAGVWEMKPCLNNVVQYESFDDFNFEYDWLSYIGKQGCYVISQISLKCSSKLLVNGIFGPVSATKSYDTNVSDTPKGFGGSATFRYKGPNSSLPSLVVSLCIDTARNTADALQEMPDKFSFQTEIYYKYKNREFVAVETKFIPSTALPGDHSLTRNFHWDIMAGSIMKRISFEILFKNKFYDYNLSWWTLEMIKLLKQLQAIQIPNLEPLKVLTYFIQRSSLLQKRNTSPDQWIIYHWTILNSPLKHIFKMVKPEVRSKTMFIENTTSILNYVEPLIVDGGNFLVVRDTSPGHNTYDDLKKTAGAIFHDETRFPKPWYRETKPGDSQDRYAIARLGLISNHALRTDDLTLDQYMALFKPKNTEK